MNTMNTSIRKSTDARSLVLTTLAMACLAVASTVVHAADKSPDSEPMKRTVKYADLNLASQQGVEQLYRRISGAAQHVCDNGESRSLQAQAQVWICTQQTIARAVAAVNQPALTALHAVKTGQPDRTAKLAKQ